MQTETYRRLIRTVTWLGYPAEFGTVLAEQLRTERAQSRMIGYLQKAKPRRPEEIADELIAILEEQERWAKKKAVEDSYSRYNAYLNSTERLETAQKTDTSSKEEESK